jgi:hypothetical protein
MEEEEAFIPNLASMLEVSLVEDTNSMVTLAAAEGKGILTIFPFERCVEMLVSMECIRFS